MKLPLKLRRRDRSKVAIAVALVGAAAISFPGMRQNSERWGRLTATIAREAEINEQLTAKQAAAADREKIAIERFQSCLLIRSPEKNTLVSVAPGIRAIDTETRLPLAPGTVVCSIDGNTGIVGAEGLVQDIAFTGDKTAIHNALQRAGIQLAPGDRQFGSSNRTFDGR